MTYDESVTPFALLDLSVGFDTIKYGMLDLFELGLGEWLWFFLENVGARRLLFNGLWNSSGIYSILCAVQHVH